MLTAASARWTVSQVDLGPTGRVMIAGQLNSSDATSSTSTSGGLVDLTGLMTIGSFTINGGQFVIGEDSVAPIAVTGNMTISHDGLFSIGRDMDNSLSINGNLVLETGGQIFVGRNLNEPDRQWQPDRQSQRQRHCCRRRTSAI